MVVAVAMVPVTHAQQVMPPGAPMGPGMRMGMHQQMQGMPDGFRFVEVGEFRLKGIAEPVRIHEVMRAEG